MKGIPEQIQTWLDGRAWEENYIGMSGSRVLTAKDRVLKIQRVSPEADNEYRVCRWLAHKIPMPEILAYEIVGDKACCLMTRISGKMICEDTYMKDPERLLEIVCQGLRMLWEVDITDCPCDSTLDVQLKEARYNVENGLVDLDNVEEETFGENGFSGPEELLRWLETNRPPEEPVFSHGDFSMPNIFADGDRISGFIDLGKAGKADRWQDLAICYRSLKHNFEGRYNGGFPYPGYHPDMLFENSFLLSARLVFEELSKISPCSPLFAAECRQEKGTSNEK